MWVNGLTFIMGAFARTVGFEIPGDLAMSIVAVVNFGLRVITKEGLS